MVRGGAKRGRELGGSWTREGTGEAVCGRRSSPGLPLRASCEDDALKEGFPQAVANDGESLLPTGNDGCL